jgi:CRP/FNR family transcriptional regulator
MRPVAEPLLGAVNAPAARTGLALVSPRHDAPPPAIAPQALLPLGLDEEIARDFARLFVHPRRLPRKEVLYRAGEPLTALHVVRLGSLKTVMLAEDGREQITGYHMAGEIVGLEGIGRPLHSCDAIALEDSEVSSLPFARIDELARDPRLMNGLFQLMARDMRRSQDLIMLLGSMCAEERLATFLLNLSERHQARGFSATDLTLRMTREEIASFLGLKLETVSRTFSRLQGQRLIQVEGRAVSLLDPAGLRRIAGQV